MKLPKSLFVWLVLCLLAVLSWLSAEHHALVAALAVAKFLGIFWIFMEMSHAHRAWLALAVVYLTLWSGALLLV
ncbi:MAG: hypothetical protein R3F39_05970 [Myxococcota bacterium]